MNRVLEIGYKLKLSGKEFIIKDIVGKGASSVTYLAEHGKTEHILKECNPLGTSMHRNEISELVADSDLSRQKFEECLERFKAGADKHLSFRLTEDLKNPTSNIQDIYHANGTAYIDMTYFGGKTYDKLDSETLYDLFRRMKALAQIVGHYHKLGYLHLDIKPQNIYTIPETPEMVMMFDFDSVTPINDINAIISSSYTDVWAAPEQKMPKYRNQICEATDLFAIGEIIFFKLFDRHSEENDRYSFSQYEYLPENKWFENVNPRVCPLITELLHKTLSCSAKKRYQKAEELLEQLDTIIELSNPKEPFLKSSLPNVSGFFTGRDSEIEEIHKRLQENNVLFLSGIGGIGKSELAKHYAEVYKDSYDAIIFAPFVNDIQTMIADDSYVLIHNFARGSEEKPNEYFERKIKELAKLCNERTLIIVDNFDTTKDENLDKLLSINCKMLITTRRDFSGFNKQQMCVDKLHSNSEIRKIFDTYYKVSDEEESACVDEIIELVEGHTMTVELIAKQIEAEWATADEILDKLKEAGISGIGESDVDSGKDNDFKRKSTYDHIKALFDLSVFEKSSDKNALYVLANLSLVPHTGIDRKFFAKWCELEKHGGTDCVNKLIKNGWIREEKRKEEKITVVSLHPLVCDLVAHLCVDFSLIETILQNLTTLIEDDYCNVCALNNVQRNEIKKMASFVIWRMHQAEYLNYTVMDFAHAVGVFYKHYSLFNYSLKAFELSYSIAATKYGVLSSEALLIRTDMGLMLSHEGHYTNQKSRIQNGIDILAECLAHYECLDISVDICDGTYSVANSLGVAYTYLSRPKDAIVYFKKALEISNQFENTVDRKNAIALGCNNIATQLVELKRYEEAKDYFVKAIENCQGSNTGLLATIQTQMAKALYMNKEFDEALRYSKMSLEIREELFGHNSYEFARGKLQIGQIYVAMKNHDSIALSYLINAKEVMQLLPNIMFDDIEFIEHYIQIIKDRSE